MQIPDKIQSTKLGIAGIALYMLSTADASPWCLVVVAAAYMFCNAIRTIGTKKNG